MGVHSVAFVAFEKHENLGIGYMNAVLSEAGYHVSVIDFIKEKQEILNEVLSLNPMVIGFSVIFENHLYDFKELIAYLRDQGIHCHFTAGGHFASLRPAEFFEFFPRVDSVVRFEGERTVVDLVDRIRLGNDWKKVAGISFLDKGKLVNNPLRALEPDLDNFPFPIRTAIKNFALDKTYATLIAGRGCIYHCIFCDIREFYSQASGPVKRIRYPEKVVEEMNILFREHGCTIFLFQDDDFPVRTGRRISWVQEFCDAIVRKGLSGKVMWKINCRPDEVDRDIFELMKQHGLFKVFLGIEDGTDEGLQRMNKRITVRENLEGIQALKELGIGMDYGFMLFQPETTFTSLNENLDFLEQIGNDGLVPVTFLKMLPYLATGIERELKVKGRLKGRPGFLDYDFHQQSMNDLYDAFNQSFNTWFNASSGVANMTKWAMDFLSVYTFFYGSPSGIRDLSDELTLLVKKANRLVIDNMRQLSAYFESGKYIQSQDSFLREQGDSIAENHQIILEKILKIIGKIEIYAVTRNLMKW